MKLRAKKNSLFVYEDNAQCQLGEYKGKIYPTREVPVKDVSGAGDTFMAGLVYQYVSSNNMEEAIDFAQTCTTKVVQKTGVATL